MFRLRRYFSIASLVGIVITVAALSMFQRHLAFDQLERGELRRVVFLANNLLATHWSEYESLIDATERVAPDELASRVEVQQFRYAALLQLTGFEDVLKLKVYALDGTTLYSTDSAQIGESEADNPGFRAARNGGSASAIIYRNRLDGFEGVVVDRNLASVYLPVRMHSAAPIRGVLEIYTDVTDLVAQLEQAQRRVVGGVVVALGLLYAFLFLIVNRAQHLIDHQESERKAQERVIRHQAFHDPLTGLANRAAFKDRLQEAVARSVGEHRLLALLFIDLDRFKEVNDRYGHGMGDRLLFAVGARIHASLRDSDQLFRMGGDEFTVIAEDIHEPAVAARIAERVIEATARPVVIDRHHLLVGASIGIALCPRDQVDAEQLVRCADAAMYAAKAAGRGCYQGVGGDIAATATAGQTSDERAPQVSAEPAVRRQDPRRIH